MSLKLSGRQKAILWIGVLLCLWQVYLNDRILSAIFTFMASGAVPGTGMRLSPDAVLTLLPVVFFLIVLLTFRREFMKLIRGLGRSFRRGEGQALSFAEASAEEITPVAEEPLAAQAEMSAEPTTTVAPQPRRQISWRIPSFIRTWIVRLGIWLSPRLHQLAYWAGFGWEWLLVQMGRLWRFTVRAVRFAWRVMKIEIGTIARLTARLTVRGWRWLSPYLWQFDRWLGEQLHKALKSRQVRELRRTLRDMKQTLVRLIRR